MSSAPRWKYGKPVVAAVVAADISRARAYMRRVSLHHGERRAMIAA